MNKSPYLSRSASARSPTQRSRSAYDTGRDARHPRRKVNSPSPGHHFDPPHALPADEMKNDGNESDDARNEAPPRRRTRICRSERSAPSSGLLTSRYGDIRPHVLASQMQIIESRSFGSEAKFTSRQQTTASSEATRFSEMAWAVAAPACGALGKGRRHGAPQSR